MIPDSIRDTIETALIESRETRGAMTNEEWGKWRKECDAALAYIQQDAPQPVAPDAAGMHPNSAQAMPKPDAREISTKIRDIQNNLDAIASELGGIVNSIQDYHYDLEAGGTLDADYMLNLATKAALLIRQLQRPAPTPDSSEEVDRGS